MTTGQQSSHTTKNHGSTSTSTSTSTNTDHRKHLFQSKSLHITSMGDDTINSILSNDESTSYYSTSLSPRSPTIAETTTTKILTSHEVKDVERMIIDSSSKPAVVVVVEESGGINDTTSVRLIPTTTTPTNDTTTNLIHSNYDLDHNNTAAAAVANSGGGTKSAETTTTTSSTHHDIGVVVEEMVMVLVDNDESCIQSTTPTTIVGVDGETIMENPGRSSTTTSSSNNHSSIGEVENNNNNNRNNNTGSNGSSSSGTTTTSSSSTATTSETTFTDTTASMTTILTNTITTNPTIPSYPHPNDDIIHVPNNMNNTSSICNNENSNNNNNNQQQSGGGGAGVGSSGNGGVDPGGVVEKIQQQPRRRFSHHTNISNHNNTAAVRRGKLQLNVSSTLYNNNRKIMNYYHATTSSNNNNHRRRSISEDYYFHYQRQQQLLSGGNGSCSPSEVMGTTKGAPTVLPLGEPTTSTTTNTASNASNASSSDHNRQSLHGTMLLRKTSLTYQEECFLRDLLQYGNDQHLQMATEVLLNDDIFFQQNQNIHHNGGGGNADVETATANQMQKENDDNATIPIIETEQQQQQQQLDSDESKAISIDTEQDQAAPVIIKTLLNNTTGIKAVMSLTSWDEETEEVENFLMSLDTSGGMRRSQSESSHNDHFDNQNIVLCGSERRKSVLLERKNQHTQSLQQKMWLAHEKFGLAVSDNSSRRSVLVREERNITPSGNNSGGGIGYMNFSSSTMSPTEAYSRKNRTMNNIFRTTGSRPTSPPSVTTRMNITSNSNSRRLRSASMHQTTRTNGGGLVFNKFRRQSSMTQMNQNNKSGTVLSSLPEVPPKGSLRRFKSENNIGTHTTPSSRITSGLSTTAMGVGAKNVSFNIDATHYRQNQYRSNLALQAVAGNVGATATGGEEVTSNNATTKPGPPVRENSEVSAATFPSLHIGDEIMSPTNSSVLSFTSSNNFLYSRTDTPSLHMAQTILSEDTRNDTPSIHMAHAVLSEDGRNDTPSIHMARAVLSEDSLVTHTENDDNIKPHRYYTIRSADPNHMVLDVEEKKWDDYDPPLDLPSLDPKDTGWKTKTMSSLEQSRMIQDATKILSLSSSSGDVQQPIGCNGDTTPTEATKEVKNQNDEEDDVMIQRAVIVQRNPTSHHHNDVDSDKEADDDSTDEEGFEVADWETEQASPSGILFRLKLHQNEVQKNNQDYDPRSNNKQDHRASMKKTESIATSIGYTVSDFDIVGGNSTGHTWHMTNSFDDSRFLGYGGPIGSSVDNNDNWNNTNTNSIFRRVIRRSLSDENNMRRFSLLDESYNSDSRIGTIHLSHHNNDDASSWKLDDDDYEDYYGDDDGVDGFRTDQSQIFDAWKVIEDEYENGYGGGGTLPFLILGTSANDVDAHPHVLSPPLMESLLSFTPAAISNDNWWMKYSLVRDGASFYSLLQQSRGSQYTFLAIETVDGEVFGSFTSSPWRKNWHSYGNGAESFLWRMKQTRKVKVHSIIDQAQLESEIEVYPYTGINNSIQLCTHNLIAIGGISVENNANKRTLENVQQISDNHDKKDLLLSDAAKDFEWGFGLTIESDLLHGTSSPCLTYGSPSLSTIHSDGSLFEIMNLELWTFTPCSRVEDAEKLEFSKLFLEKHTATTPTSNSATAVSGRNRQ